MMLFTDGGSSYRKPYFLSKKSADATLQALKDFKVEAETQTGKKLKIIQLYMGKEFINRAMQDFCRENGIIIESTVPYAHASNGVAERANRTVIEGIRCILSDSGMPPSLWADAAAFYVYTRNLVPSSRHKGRVPAEAWTQKCKMFRTYALLGVPLMQKFPGRLIHQS
jgi:hypothetical protein